MSYNCLTIHFDIKISLLLFRKILLGNIDNYIAKQLKVTVESNSKCEGLSVRSFLISDILHCSIGHE